MRLHFHLMETKLYSENEKCKTTANIQWEQICTMHIAAIRRMKAREWGQGRRDEFWLNMNCQNWVKRIDFLHSWFVKATKNENAKCELNFLPEHRPWDMLSMETRHLQSNLQTRIAVHCGTITISQNCNWHSIFSSWMGEIVCARKLVGKLKVSTFYTLLFCSNTGNNFVIQVSCVSIKCC